MLLLFNRDYASFCWLSCDQKFACTARASAASAVPGSST
jgi:hypothetical protein